MDDLKVELKFVTDHEETAVMKLVRRFDAELINEAEGDMIFSVRVPYLLYRDDGTRTYDPRQIEIDDIDDTDIKLIVEVKKMVKAEMRKAQISEVP